MPFVVIQLFRSVSSCPYRRDGVFVDTNLQQSKGLYLVNELATMEEVLIGFAWQQMKGYSSFVFSEDIQQFDSLFFWRLSMTFVIHLKDKLVSVPLCQLLPVHHAKPFPFPRSAGCISDEYWKELALWNRKVWFVRLSEKFIS